MTPNTQESSIALQAVHWYVENIYGQDVNLCSLNTIEEHFKFVIEHNDSTLQSFWNDFALRHNHSADEDQLIPLISHKHSV